jgi:hypothetical protein
VRAAIQPTNSVEHSNENTKNSKLFPVFQAAKPTTMMMTRNTPPPLVGSNGKSMFATSTRAERASGGTMKIVNSSAISSETIAATPASHGSLLRRAQIVTNAEASPASTSRVLRATRVNEGRWRVTEEH